MSYFFLIKSSFICLGGTTLQTGKGPSMAKMYNGDLVAPVLNPQQISGFQARKVVLQLCALRGPQRASLEQKLAEKVYISPQECQNSSPVPSMSFRVCFGIFIYFCSAFSGNVLFFSFKNFT